MRGFLLVLLLVGLTVPVCSCDGEDPSTSSGQAPTEDDDTISDDSATQDDTVSDDDTFEGRSFYMAAVPFRYQLDAYSSSSEFDMTGFDGRVDAVSLHMEFFGVPWDEFATDADLPAAWVEKMTSIRDDAEDLDAAVYLSLTPLSGMRSGVAPKATDVDGTLVLVENWLPDCYNFETGEEASFLHGAYVKFVRWMVDFFQPKFLTNVIEINGYNLYCPDEYDSVIALANEVYDDIKSIDADLAVFPTFILDIFYGYGDSGDCEVGDDSCLLASIERIGDLKRDRFGISAYPLFMSYEWDKISDDYFSKVADYTGEIPVFGETGYGTQNVFIPTDEDPDTCWQIFEQSNDAQIDYMTFLFEQAEAMGSDLVTWWSLRDYLPEDVLNDCPCDAEFIWCAMYDVVTDIGLLPAWISWGSMGVYDYDLVEKPSMDLWMEWLDKPRGP